MVAFKVVTTYAQLDINVDKLSSEYDKSVCPYDIAYEMFDHRGEGGTAARRTGFDLL
jgi:hypothetical protein